MNENKKFVIRCRAIIIHDGKLLVVKHPHNTSFAALPGGHLEWGEDVIECMSREIEEELGVKPEIGRLLYINTFADGENSQPMEFFFEVKNGKDYVDSEKLVRSHAHEIAEIIWASPTDNIKILPQQLGQDFKESRVLSDTVRYISGFRKIS
ncbi:MAG: NUDIX domain-containing protein [bacterium]|nr:NUDIX domain-containing protein [bacterium]